MADNGLAQAIIDCIIEQFSMVPEELGPNIVVDPADPSTFPIDSGDFKKQCLLDADGNFVGFVGPDGVHLEQDEGDDEVGPAIVVAEGGTPPTTTEQGTNGPYECQKVLDEDGNLIGMVGTGGYFPIAGKKYICQDDEPVYTENTLWFSPSMGCWFGPCDGVWMGMGGGAASLPCDCPSSLPGVTGAGNTDSAGNVIAYVDQSGNPIPAGTSVINFEDAEGNYIVSWV